MNKDNELLPTVSVVIPVYNISDYIEQCVSSVISQSYGDFEIILVDDGSTDASGSICDSLALNDSRIRVVHKSNGGLSDARNFGLSLALGQWVMFLDGDDYLDPDALMTHISIAFATGADMTVAGFRYVSDEGDVLGKVELPLGLFDESHFWQLVYSGDKRFKGISNTACIVAWSKLYARELFETERFDIMRYHEDEYILHRIISKANLIATIDSCLYNYRQRDGSIMTDRQSPLNNLDKSEAIALRADYLVNRGLYEAGGFAVIESARCLARASLDKRPE